MCAASVMGGSLEGWAEEGLRAGGDLRTGGRSGIAQEGTIRGADLLVALYSGVWIEFGVASCQEQCLGRSVAFAPQTVPFGVGWEQPVLSDLKHQKSPMAEEGGKDRISEQLQGKIPVAGLFGIGGIGENEVRRLDSRIGRKKTKNIVANHSGLESCADQIFGDNRASLSIYFHQGSGSRPPAERLNSDRTAARKKIQHNGFGDVLCQTRENCPAHQIHGGPQRRFGKSQRDSSRTSRNYAHSFIAV